MPDTLARFVSALLLALLLAPTGVRADRRRGADTLANRAPFALDAGRIMVEIGMRKRDGGVRKALAWFNMGMASPTLTEALYRELEIDNGLPLRIELAGVALEAPASAVTNGDGGLAAPTFAHLFAPHPVEAMLPASLLRDYAVTIDYGHRTLTLTMGGARNPVGVAVPFALNEKTGFATVDVAVEGETHPFVIDAGSGYSWMRGRVLAHWLTAHPDWRRAEGAIGLANANMLDYAFEKRGTLARLPAIAIGPVVQKEVGVLGTGPVFGSFIDGVLGDFFWDNWQKSASGPVVGWLGYNVLHNFTLTMDFPARTSYWRAAAEADPHDLDQVGVTLVRRDGRYFIGGLIAPEEAGASENAAPGDELVGVGALEVRGASKTAVLAALGGKPGELRQMRLLRDGRVHEVSARVLDLR